MEHRRRLAAEKRLSLDRGRIGHGLTKTDQSLIFRNNVLFLPVRIGFFLLCPMECSSSLNIFDTEALVDHALEVNSFADLNAFFLTEGSSERKEGHFLLTRTCF